MGRPKKDGAPAKVTLKKTEVESPPDRKFTCEMKIFTKEGVVTINSETPLTEKEIRDKAKDHCDNGFILTAKDGLSFNTYTSYTIQQIFVKMVPADDVSSS